jgi:RHS repeat-associated protein
MDMEYVYSSTANNGRITQAKDWVNDEEVNYEYDSLQRLVKAYTTDAEWGQEYSYDGFGNMSAQTGVTGKGTVPVFSLTLNSAKNQVSNWSYDSNGNVTQMGAGGPTYTYDVETRLISSTASTATYAYDSENRRIFDGSDNSYTFWTPDGRAILRYTLAVQFNAQSGVWEQVAVPKETRLYFAGKLIGVANPTQRPVVSEALVTDRLGSVRSRGTQSMRYFPYGQEMVATANGKDKFGTYFRDAGTGLDYAHQRYYRPGTGRFMTADPYVASGGPASPSSWNRYAYVEGDPVNYLDPSGLDRVSGPSLPWLPVLLPGIGNEIPSGYSNWTDYFDSLVQ